MMHDDSWYLIMFVETRQPVQDGNQYLMKVSYKMKKYYVKLIDDI
jgi:hypothetical protein